MLYYECIMKKYFFLFLVISGLILYSCASQKMVNPHLKNTPGVVAINETLMCDQTEATNFNWLEYLNWTQRTFGADSEEYFATLPDSSKLKKNKCPAEYSMDHFRSWEYIDLPVMRISQEQAQLFSQWRSDRVFEYLLIKEGEIESNPNQNAENYFSITNYFNGFYYSVQDTNGQILGTATQPDLERMYPQYRLPNAEDRILLLDYVDSTDHIFHQKKERHYSKWRESNLPFQLAISTCDKVAGTTRENKPLRSVSTGLDSRNKFNLIHNTRGNVAEWGAEPNITYGGGWPHNVEYILSKDTVSVTAPNAWTGFRNVCEWKKWIPNGNEN